MQQLKAAAGVVDLRARPGCWMTGYGARTEPSMAMNDPIQARALLVESKERLLIVSCDLIGLSTRDCLTLRERISKVCGVTAEAILICCTHTHAGPASLPFRGIMGIVDPTWLAGAFDEIVSLCASLPSRLEPASLFIASTQVSALAYNRQHESRPIDDELIAVEFWRKSGEAIASVVNYAMHPVILGAKNRILSAEYPGVLAREIEAARGGQCLFLLGAAGDVNPVICKNRRDKTTFRDVEGVGRALASAAIGALGKAEEATDVAVSSRATEVQVELDDIPDELRCFELREQFEKDRVGPLVEYIPDSKPVPRSELLARLGFRIEQANAALQWLAEVRQASRLGISAGPLTVEVLAARIGPLMIAAMPFEPYSDIGLSIKAALGPRPTLFAGYANGLFGYAVSDWAKAQGGYASEEAYLWYGELLSPLAYGADKLLVHGCLAAVREMQAR